MQLSDFLAKHKILDDYFYKQNPEFSKEFRTLGRLSKISEEVGELNSAVLAEMGLQRQEKLEGHHFENIETEWADVFNTLISFAFVMDLDVEKILNKRMEQILVRYGLQEKED